MPTFVNHCHNLVYDFRDCRIGSVVQYGEFVLVTSRLELSKCETEGFDRVKNILGWCVDKVGKCKGVGTKWL